MNLDSEVRYSALCERNLVISRFVHSKANSHNDYRRGWAGSIAHLRLLLWSQRISGREIEME